MYELYYYSFYAENFYLDIKKTNCSHHRCCLPGCGTPTNNIRRIPINIRYKAMKTKKIFIPHGATACSVHQSIDNLNENVLKRRSKFTPDKIKEMLDLLCNFKQKNTVEDGLPGKNIKKE